MSFTIFQNEKTPFQAIKTRSSKGGKNAIFPKGLIHGFGRKNGYFSNFSFLGKIGQENVLYDILERKNAFLGYKNKKFKNSKNWYFSKGVNPSFSDKNGLFWQLLFFQAKQGNKMSFTIFQNDKTPFWAQKKEVQKVEKFPFFQRG